MKIPEDYLLEIKALKELTWLYVIDSQSLATQQYGKGKIIETLFMIYFEALHSNSRGLNILPPLYRETWEELFARANGKNEFKSECERLAADIISGMTDQEALLMYKRLTGINPGSLIDVR